MEDYYKDIIDTVSEKLSEVSQDLIDMNHRTIGRVVAECVEALQTATIDLLNDIKGNIDYEEGFDNYEIDFDVCENADGEKGIKDFEWHYPPKDFPTEPEEEILAQCAWVDVQSNPIKKGTYSIVAKYDTKEGVWRTAMPGVDTIISDMIVRWCKLPKVDIIKTDTKE